MSHWGGAICVCLCHFLAGFMWGPIVFVYFGLQICQTQHFGLSCVYIHPMCFLSVSKASPEAGGWSWQGNVRNTVRLVLATCFFFRCAVVVVASVPCLLRFGRCSEQHVWVFALRPMWWWRGLLARRVKCNNRCSTPKLSWGNICFNWVRGPFVIKSTEIWGCFLGLVQRCDVF